MLGMFPELGHYFLILAGFVAASQLHPALAVRGAVIQAGLCALSFGALLWSFAVSDFTVAAVAEHSHTLLPLPRKMAGIFYSPGGLALALTAAVATAAIFTVFRKAPSAVFRATGAAGVLLVVLTLMLHPFARIYPPPFDGLGFDPFRSAEAATAAMPSFTAGDLQSGDIHGPALLNFFASWCPPCEGEHPALSALAKDIPVYGIAFKDKPEAVDGYLQRLGNPYAKTGDDKDGSVAYAFGLSGVPATLLIDAHGRIIGRYEEPLSDDDIAAIRKALP